MAFHSYTHLIGKLFNAYPFGPPFRVTGTSTWTCVDHSVSRLPPMTLTPYSGSLSLRLGNSCSLTWPETVTRRFIMQKARRHPKGAPTACRRMVSGTISLLYARCFSPFPHGTGSLSVSHEYLALPDGPGRFTQNSSCSALLRIPLRLDMLRIRNYHALWLNFPEHSSHISSSDVEVLQPQLCRNIIGLGSSPFARHYWGNHCYFLFLQVLRCFSSLR